MQVNSHDVIECIQINFAQCLRAHQADVVDQPVEGETFAEFLEYLCAAFAVGQIKGDQCAGEIRVVCIAGYAHHGVACLGQMFAQRATDAFAGAGDKVGTLGHGVLPI